MEATTVLVLTLAILALVLVLVINNKRRRITGLPPGSMGWPLVGEALSFLKPHPTTCLGDFMQQRISTYGKIFTTNLFGKLAIVSADAELNHFIVQNDMKLFEHGWPQYFAKMVGESAVLLSTGHAHKTGRSLILNFFSNKRFESSVLHDARQLATMIMSSWKDESMIHAKDEVMKFTFNMIAKKTMNLAPDDVKTEMLRREFDTFIKGMFSAPLKLPGTAYWKSLQSRNNISKSIKQIIEERMQKQMVGHTKEEEGDLLGWLMENSSYTWDQIIDQLRTIILSGYLTTSRTMPTLIYFLGECPKAIEQLREEHLQTIHIKKQSGESELTWEDYKNMEFTQCVINETLRLGSGGLLQKKTSTNIQYKGYVIPRGCIVMAHISAMHLDPCLYEDPERFNPWRWLGASDTKNFGFMPFGRGVRQCPGANFARLEMIVFLHHLILNYNWKPVFPDYPITLPLVDFRKGLPIKVQALSLESTLHE